MKGKTSSKIAVPVLIFFVVFFVLLSGCISVPGPGKAALYLTSSPSGAEVYLDNQYRGSTPVTLPDVESGAHSLEFRYAGYQSWSAGITVTTGPSNYYAALTPQTNIHQSQEIFPAITPVLPSQTKVTIQAGKKIMIIGDSNFFSGTAVGPDSVLLTLYGPGYYAKGVLVDTQKVSSIGSWGYIWNKGTSILSGVYTMVVEDPQKTTSDRVEFSVVGGGEVSITSNSYAATAGDVMRFSGRCTTGAPNVLLVLYGPGQFTGGVELGVFSVQADKTWNFKYTLDNSIPTGSYTMYVYDIPKTTSSTVQFSVGYIS